MNLLEIVVFHGALNYCLLIKMPDLIRRWQYWYMLIAMLIVFSNDGGLLHTEPDPTVWQCWQCWVKLSVLLSWFWPDEATAPAAVARVEPEPVRTRPPQYAPRERYHLKLEVTNDPAKKLGE